MNDLASTLATGFGLQRSQVEAALGTILNFLSAETGPNVTQALNAIQGAGRVMDAYPFPSPGGPQEGVPVVGAGSQIQPLLARLIHHGIRPEAVSPFLSEVLGYLRSKMGNGTFESMLINVPELRPLEARNQGFTGMETLI